MISLEEKKAVFALLLERLQREFETVAAAQKATQEGATHEEAKPENDKDTRALEQSYLARGQAERVLSLKTDVGLLSQLNVRAYSEDQKVGLGALVKVEDDEGLERLYLLAPAGAGERLESTLGELKVVTPGSPLGRALLGQRLGEDFEMNSPTGKRTLTLIEIA